MENSFSVGWYSGFVVAYLFFTFCLFGFLWFIGKYVSIEKIALITGIIVCVGVLLKKWFQ